MAAAEFEGAGRCWMMLQELVVLRGLVVVCGLYGVWDQPNYCWGLELGSFLVVLGLGVLVELCCGVLLLLLLRVALSADSLYGRGGSR